MKQKIFNIKISSDFNNFDIFVYSKSCLICEKTIVNERIVELCVCSNENIFIKLLSQFGDEKILYLKFYDGVIYQIAFNKRKNESVQLFTLKDSIYGLKVLNAVLTFS